VLGETHLPLVIAPVSFPLQGPLELTVESGGVIAGYVRLHGWPPQSLGLLIYPHVEGNMGFGNKPNVQLASDGSFRSRDLAPGEWRIALILGSTAANPISRFSQSTVFEPELATVTVQPGHTTEVDLDASPFAPGTVVGHVLLNGDIPEGAKVSLLREWGTANSTHWQGTNYILLDHAGRFEADFLPPSKYGAALRLSDGSQIPLDEPFELRPGAFVERTFAFERRVLTLRFLLADGLSALTDEDVVLKTKRQSTTVRTDVEGLIVLDPAPSDDFRFTAGQGQLSSDPISMPPGVRKAELDVVLRGS
jgi:hypothetical protein